MSLALHIAVVDPLAGGPVEIFLNQELAAARAPFFLAVARDDRLDPGGLERLAAALRSAPPRAVGATAAVDEVRRDATLRRVPPVSLPDPRALLSRRRTPGPVLLRTRALTAAGGWRPDEAAWGDRPNRHRRLLLRLLQTGPIIASEAYLGQIARPGPPPLLPTLEGLLYRRVAITGPNLSAAGRLAAVTPQLVTLAGDDGELTLIRPDRIQSVTALPAGGPGRSPRQTPGAPPPGSQYRSAAPGRTGGE